MSSWIKGRKGRGFSLIATSALSTQSGAAVGSFAFGTLGPLGVVAIRQIAAALVLCAIARPKLRSFTGAQWRAVALLAFFFAVMNAALYTAIDRVGLGTAVTIEFLGPLAVAAWSSRRGRDFVGVALAMLGVMLLTQPSPSTDFVGIGVALIAAMCWAGYILTNRVVGRRVEGVQGTAAATVLSSLGMLPILVVIIWHAQPPPEAYLFACVAGLLATAIPYAFDLVVLRHVSPLIFGVGMSLHPLFAGIIGLLLLNQQLPLIAWSGILLVVLSNGLTLTGTRSAAGAAPRLRFRRGRRRSARQAAYPADTVTAMDIRISAYAVITDDQKRMLLPHWMEQGFGSGWTMPGGGIDPGEDPADAVVREVFEESGYRVHVTELLGIDNLVIPGDRRTPTSGREGIPLQNLRIVYRARIIGGELTVEQDGSTDDVAWFTPAEIDSLDRVSLVDTARRMAQEIS